MIMGCWYRTRSKTGLSFLPPSRKASPYNLLGCRHRPIFYKAGLVGLVAQRAVYCPHWWESNPWDITPAVFIRSPVTYLLLFCALWSVAVLPGFCGSGKRPRCILWPEQCALSTPHVRFFRLTANRSAIASLHGCPVRNHKTGKPRAHR